MYLCMGKIWYRTVTLLSAVLGIYIPRVYGVTPVTQFTLMFKFISSSIFFIKSNLVNFKQLNVQKNVILLVS